MWTHNITTQATYLYVDGVAQTFTHYSSGATTSYLTSRHTYSEINIGATWTPSEYFPGLLDEVAVFDYVLTEAQALEIFNATSTGKTADLSELATPPTAWYRMGD